MGSDRSNPCYAGCLLFLSVKIRVDLWTTLDRLDSARAGTMPTRHPGSDQGSGMTGLWTVNTYP